MCDNKVKVKAQVSQNVSEGNAISTSSKQVRYGELRTTVEHNVRRVGPLKIHLLH
jgi:hypothetical protein